jgi:hypothetical protein
MPGAAYIGRETREGLGVKRKRTNNVHKFRLPFRQELYRKHLESCTPKIGSRTRRSVRIEKGVLRREAAIGNPCLS